MIKREKQRREEARVKDQKRTRVEDRWGGRNRESEKERKGMEGMGHREKERRHKGIGV